MTQAACFMSGVRYGQAFGRYIFKVSLVAIVLFVLFVADVSIILMGGETMINDYPAQDVKTFIELSPQPMWDIEIEAIEKQRVFKYLSRFSLANIRKECKINRVNISGLTRKDEIVYRFIDEMMGTGITATDICAKMSTFYPFMKGRENG